MRKYNANGGQIRSSSKKILIPKIDRDFTNFMLALIQVREKYGRDHARKALKLYSEKFSLTGAEFDFLDSLIWGSNAK
jgi:hypothetical protein